MWMHLGDIGAGVLSGVYMHPSGSGAGRAFGCHPWDHAGAADTSGKGHRTS